MAKISVITSIYNAHEYLDRCLNSLLLQSLRDIEYIWIDNGATKECKSILKKYLSKNIKLITLKKNIGYLGAIVEGIKNASSEYIAFCDSDDWVNIDYYEKLYYELIKSDSDMAICPFVFSYDDVSKNVKADLNYYGTTETVSTVFKAINYGCIWNCVLKRNILNYKFIKQLDFSKNIFADNLILISSIANARKIILTNCTAYNYFQRKNSTISNLSKEQIKSACEYIVQELDSGIRKNEINVEQSELFGFLRRSIPIYSLDSSFVKNSIILCSSKKEYSLIYSNHIYYFPNFWNRIFSVSINKSISKIRLRFCFITFTINFLKENKL